MRPLMKSTAGHAWVVLLLILVSAALARADSIEVDEDDLDIQRPKSFIVNGTDAASGRYPYYTSLRYWKNTTGELHHFCGASLISDRLVLTAAHCVSESRPALPDDFESLALNFTSFPNTEMWEGEVYAYIGAKGEDVTGIEPNIIEMFFVHPQWDGNLIYADVAVGLLTEPVLDVPKVQVLSSKTDIYDLINPDTQSLFAIGLGRYINKEYSILLQQSHLLDYDVNDDPHMTLQEANVGTLLPRTLCGKLYTAGAQHLSNDGSGNLEYRPKFTPRVIPESQVCIAPITDDETEVYIKSLVQYIAEEILLNSTSENSDAVEATRADILDKISFYAAAYNGVCQGDSGGPILLKGSDYSQDIQIGIASFTYGCGSKLGFVASNVQAFLQDSSGFDSFLVDLLNHFPDQASKMRLANSVAAIPQSVAVSG